MKGATNHLTPGQRVAYYRRRRGMSQQTLADLVGKTLSWIEKIESGRANLQVLPNIARLAAVLDIAPLELLPDDIVDVDANTRGRSVPALRKRLLSYRFVNPAYLDDEMKPVELGELQRLVANLWRAYQASKFGYVIAELHRLLPIAMATVSASKIGPDRLAAEVQMAFIYQAAATVLSKVGEQDLAFTCADRGERLVQETPDIAARVNVQRSIAHALLATANYDDALNVVDHALRAAPRDTDPRLTSARGTLHLVGAMTAARTGDRALASTHLRYAGEASASLGADRNDLWTAFGPTNVRIHEVAVAAELSDYQRAASLGESLDVSKMPTERQVRHRLEVARALHFQRQRPSALAMVLTAEQQAPDQVRRHFLTHALLQEWVRSSKVVTPELHLLARRSGVLTS